MRDPSLWEQISEFSLDASEGSLPYSKKLAEAEGWTEAHTHEVIREYRRFVYLCMVSDDQMTPSHDIDRAWHLHLTYTRNYWEEFCLILPRPLHHEPCLGPEEMPRYEGHYEATMRLYESEFGRKPPRAVWPRPGALEKHRYFDRIFSTCVVFGIFGVLLWASVHWMLGALVAGSAAVVGVWARANILRYRAHGRKNGAHHNSWEVGAGGCGGCGD